MTRRKRQLLVLLVGAVVLIPLIAFLLSPLVLAPDLSGANFVKITSGMTREQVYSILAAPPGDYTSGPWTLIGDFEEPILEEEKLSRISPGTEMWINDEARILVQFKGGSVHRSIEPLIGWNRPDARTSYTLVVPNTRNEWVIVGRARRWIVFAWKCIVNRRH